MEITKEYSNEDITIVWKQDLCIHCGFCAKGLSDVFKPKEKPWVIPLGAASDVIMSQVQKCPSGALSFYNNIKK